MIALESCDTALVNCMNPDSLHDFGSFTVSYPPLPSSYPTIMEGTFGSRLLYISDAYCGLYTFDTSTGKWYGNKPTDIDSLMSGDEQVATVPTPPTFAGDLAMQISAPAGQGVCNGSIK